MWGSAPADSVQNVTVTWPDGRRQSFGDFQADRIVELYSAEFRFASLRLAAGTSRFAPRRFAAFGGCRGAAVRPRQG